MYEQRDMAKMMRWGLPLAVWMASAAVVSAQIAAPGASGSCTPAAPQAVVSRAAVEPPLSSIAARPSGTDLGIAPGNTSLQRMLLLLRTSAAQNAALEQFLLDQQTPGSCAYHQWLTPEQFADEYANSSADVNAVVDWLRGQGFAVAPIPSGRQWIEFSGTAQQVEQAFATPVHSFATREGTRYAIAGAIQVPAALRATVQGLVSLDAEVSAAGIVRPESATDSLGGAGFDGAVPQALQSMIHASAAAPAVPAGTGQAIAIVSRSAVNAVDVAAFHDRFGLGTMAIRQPNEITNGTNDTDKTAATLMSSWAGAVAPGAQIVLAPAANTNATDGLDLSLAAIVDGKLANTAVVGYSACEAALSPAHQAFYAALYRQAAAEGISVIAAAGDSGAACRAVADDAPIASGYSVNALAATPWNTAVGVDAASGTDLRAWSDTAGLNAGGGGASNEYALPTWQPALQGAPEGRLLPDVALPVAMDRSSSNGVLFCLAASSADGNGCNAVRSGGSAAAAAIIAGMAARLAQLYGPQGNLAPHLYAMQSQPGIFEDVQAGSAKLPCAPGSPECAADGEIGYDATAGFDLATGLGSVNADALVSAWPRAQATGTGAVNVTVAVSPSVANNLYNPTAQITFTATVTSQTGGSTPSGTVQFVNQSTNLPLGSTVTISNGTAILQFSGPLPVGVNNIVAVYSGDLNYQQTTSSPVTITTQASSTSLAVTTSSTTPSAGQSITVTATLAVGTPAEGTVAPTGRVSLKLDDVVQSSSSVSTTAGTTAATFTLTIPSGGSHTLGAVYAGDTNYLTSTSPSVTINATKGGTTTTLAATPTTLTAGVPETLTATVAPLSGTSSTASITGTVNFYDGTKLLGSGTLSSNTATLSNITLSTAASHSLTAVYTGDSNWASSTSTPVTLAPILLSSTLVLSVTPLNAAPGQVVTMTATITPTAPPTPTEQNPTGDVIFYAGTKPIGSAKLIASLANTAYATFASATLPPGPVVLTAVYVGDLYYDRATSNSVTINVEDFSIAPSSSNPPTNLNIVKGTAGTASFVVTGLGGYADTVQVVCAASTLSDISCSPSPQQITPTGTVSFTVQTYKSGGPSMGMRGNGALPWTAGVGGTALGGLCLLLLPFRRIRDFRRKAGRYVLMGLLLIGLCGGTNACQSISGAVSSVEGTPLGVATLTITATAYIDNTVVSHTVYLTVNVLPS